MSSRTTVTRRFAQRILSCIFVAGCLQGIGYAQLAASPSLHFQVQGPTQRMEMIVNSSRILTMDMKIPRAQVNNPEVLRLVPLSATQIQVSAIKSGVTQVNLWDEDDQIYTVDVMVYGDARELEMLLKSEFPTAALKVRPLASSVFITGFVPRADMVSRITQMAEDYYPKVINNITVGGVQQVLLHVKIMEVSRTKLRKLGIDWANINGNDVMVSTAAGLIDASTAAAGTAISQAGADTLRFGIIDGVNNFTTLIEALRQNNLVKILAEPTLVTMSGRPSSFSVGGEFPIVVPSGIGSSTIEFKEFGTRVDFVPIVLGNGAIRLEVRPYVSEIDESRNVVVGSFTVPGLRHRWVDTAVEMQAGQTLALAGLIQERMEAENKGLPWFSDLPGVGAAFRRVQQSKNEIELLIVVTPELVDAVDLHELPPCGPGQSTTDPDDKDLYWRGYLEVPTCCGPNGTCLSCNPGAGIQSGVQFDAPHAVEKVPPLAPAPSLPDPAESRYPIGAGNRAQAPTQQILLQQPLAQANNSRPGLDAALRSQFWPSRNLTISTESGTRMIRHNSSNQNQAFYNSPVNPTSFQPGMIGPVGYDVHN